MPSHVHMVLAPADEDGPRRALAPVHRRYAGHIHARFKTTGHFWQGRFGAVAMDEEHLAAALHYMAFNPVRACLAPRPQDWPWSSVHAHLAGRSEGLTTVEPVLKRFSRFAQFIGHDADAAATGRRRRAESIGRPLGNGPFIAGLEEATGRTLKQRKRGPNHRG
jgi:putative transposase